MDIDSLRAKSDKILKRAVRVLIPLGVTPNLLTLISFGLAVVSAILFYFSGASSSLFYLFSAGLFLSASAFLDAMDGPLAREMNIATKKGDFLDHALDRYADVLILLGIIFGGYIYWPIGLMAVIGVLLTSYFGVQAQALGFSREYRGFGRAYRLVVLILATFLNLIYPAGIGGLSFLGWAMVVFAVFATLTAFQRSAYTWRALNRAR